MSIDLRLTGGTVATPAGNVVADVLVDSEKVVGTGASGRPHGRRPHGGRHRQARATRHDRPSTCTPASPDSSTKKTSKQRHARPRWAASRRSSGCPT